MQKEKSARSTGEEIPANIAAAGNELNIRSFHFVWQDDPNTEKKCKGTQESGELLRCSNDLYTK
jgi:hypothetical protein